MVIATGTELFDEDLPVTVAKVEDIDFYQQVNTSKPHDETRTLRSPVTIPTQPKRNVAIMNSGRSSSTTTTMSQHSRRSSCGGFDNVAFEGYSPIF